MSKLELVPTTWDVMVAGAMDAVHASVDKNTIFHRGIDSVPMAPSNIYGRRRSSVLVPFTHDNAEPMVRRIFAHGQEYPADSFGFAVSSLSADAQEIDAVRLAIVTTMLRDPRADYNGMEFGRDRFKGLPEARKRTLFSLAQIVTNAAAQIPNSGARTQIWFSGGIVLG